MLSTSHKFLFIHVPKTGGNSIQNVLSEYADDRIACVDPWHDGVERFQVASDRYQTTKHSTLADYRAQYGESLFNGLFKFCAVRNPWEMCVSAFFSPHRGNKEWDEEKFRKLLDTEIHPLRHYVCQPDQGLSEAIASLGIAMRFENLQVDFDSACDVIGIKRARLPHRNASNKGNYRQYYSRGLVDLVAAKYQEEIEHFGYSF